MRVEQRTSPTRFNLLRIRRQKGRVQTGAQLLRRKREALVGELLRDARPWVGARQGIADLSRRAHTALFEALALHGEPGLRSRGRPERTLHVQLRAADLWGAHVAAIGERPLVARTLAARGTAPGSTGPAAAAAARGFEALTERLLEAAPQEIRIRRLGTDLSETSRQLNRLEKRLAPSLEQQAARIARVLEEREREEHLRFKHLARRRTARRRS